jgi:hypothetical protein
MHEEEKEREPLDEEELEAIDGEPVPDREAMSIITPTPGNDLWSTPVEPPGT